MKIIKERINEMSSLNEEINEDSMEPRNI